MGRVEIVPDIILIALYTAERFDALDSLTSTPDSVFAMPYRFHKLGFQALGSDNFKSRIFFNLS